MILFTNSAAANRHVTTLAEIEAALASHNAIAIPLSFATFHCSVVSAAAYARGIPWTS